MLLFINIIFIFYILIGHIHYQNEIVYPSVPSVCMPLMIIFLFSAISFIYKYKRKNLISFELFFFIIFFLANFLYPIFFYNNVPIKMFSAIEDYIIVKSVSISLLGFLFYIIGAILFTNKGKVIDYSITDSSIKHYNFESIIKLSNIITSLFIALYILFDGIQIINRYTQQVELHDIEGASLIFYVRNLLIISIMLEFLRLKQNNIASLSLLVKYINKHLLLNIFIFVLLFILAGYRAEFVPILLVLLFSYSIFIRKIKTKYVFLCIFLGFFFLSTLKNLRSTGDFLGNLFDWDHITSFNFYELSRDFFGANATLYNLVEFTDAHGPTKGTNIIFPFLSIIPFLQGLIVYLFDINVSNFEYWTSSVVATTNILGPTPYTGLGTNVIGDIYYTFGLGGVIVIMFLFGSCISYLNNKLFSSKNINIYLLLIYLIILSNSIFLSRVEFFFIFRSLGFSVIILYLMSLFAPFKYYNLSYNN